MTKCPCCKRAFRGSKGRWIGRELESVCLDWDRLPPGCRGVVTAESKKRVLVAWASGPTEMLDKSVVREGRVVKVV